MSPETLLVLFAVACAGCGNDWRTDMWFQPGGGLHSIARPEPEGSVPLDARPHFDDRDEAETLREAFPADAASIARGRTLFLERCVSCHGSEGHGGGPVGRYFPPAPDLGYPVIQARPDGYVYATIVLGGKAMPVMREGLSQKDLWDLVHFVRTIKAKAAP
jgi:mono/diheme cytochrome c family protein